MLVVLVVSTHALWKVTAKATTMKKPEALRKPLYNKFRLNTRFFVCAFNVSPKTGISPSLSRYFCTCCWFLHHFYSFVIETFTIHPFAVCDPFYCLVSKNINNNGGNNMSSKHAKCIRHKLCTMYVNFRVCVFVLCACATCSRKKECGSRGTIKINKSTHTSYERAASEYTENVPVKIRQTMLFM